MNIIKHETIDNHMKSNIAYCCNCVKLGGSENGVALIGSENKTVTKYKFDSKDLEFEKLGSYVGHSNSVRNV